MKNSILCIGVANVDVIKHVDTGFLVRHRIDKGTTTLMRSADILSMIHELQNPAFIPGGCAANTSCGISALGIETIFTGMIHADEGGQVFSNGFSPYGVKFHAGFHPEKKTSFCATLVTPDKERSFVLSPDAASWYLGEANLPDHDLEKPLIVYTEANLFRMTAGTTSQSMAHAVIEKYTGPKTRIILNLIDTDITIHQRQTVMNLIRQKKLAYIMCNAEELMALCDSDLDTAMETAGKTGQVFITTLGKDGAAIIENGTITRIEPIFVAHEDIRDLIGAGDQFAAGFVAGIASGKSVLDACRQGALKASEIIVVEGARPHIKA